MHKEHLYTKKQRQEIIDILLKGDEEAVHLLENGIRINIVDDNGNTAFHLAEEQDNVESYKFFYDRGALNRWSFSGGYSTEDYRHLLFSAIRDGRENIVKFLVQNVQELHDFNRFETDYYHRPLHLAVSSGNENLVKYVLSFEGVDLDKINHCGETALDVAILNEDKGIVELLLNQGSQINSVINSKPGQYGAYPIYYKRLYGIKAPSNSPLHCASIVGSESIVTLLLEKGANISTKNKYELSVLHSAVIGGNEKIVKLFLNSGLEADAKDKDGWTPLSYVNYGDDKSNIFYAYLHKGKSDTVDKEKIIELLLQHKANVNSRIRKGKEGFYENILHLACAKGYERIVKLLLDKDADFNGIEEWNQRNPLYSAFDEHESHERKYNETALHLAASNNNIKIVELLINYGANVNCQRKDGYFPLDVASKCGNEDVVKILLKQGANVKAKNAKGGTALHSAVKGGNENIVHLLLSHGLDIHEKVGSSGYNALHFAAKTGNKSVVEMLLNLGADINSQTYCNKKGAGQDTALSIACVKGHEEVVKLLLEKGALIFQGSTNVLERSRNERILRILLDYGVEVDEKDKGGNTALLNYIVAFSRFENLWPEDNSHFHDYESEAKKKVEQLLDYGATVDIENIIEFAVNMQFFELLVEYQANINTNGKDEVLKALNYRNSLSQGRGAFDVKLLVRHIVKLLSEHHHVKQEYLDCINSNANVKGFKTKCESEIDKMKKTMIPETSVFPYDILVSNNASELAAYARNEKIVQEVSSVRCIIEYPIYSSVLNNQLRRGKWRYLLLDAVQYFFKAHARTKGNEKIPRLPKECVDMIYANLSNKDLKILVQVCNVPFDADICDIEI